MSTIGTKLLRRQFSTGRSHSPVLNGPVYIYQRISISSAVVLVASSSRRAAPPRRRESASASAAAPPPRRIPPSAPALARLRSSPAPPPPASSAPPSAPDLLLPCRCRLQAARLTPAASPPSPSRLHHHRPRRSRDFVNSCSGPGRRALLLRARLRLRFRATGRRHGDLSPPVISAPLGADIIFFIFRYL
ncbi:hypothetical protein PVAP13_6KG109540 [Panicum virgatum]|jgi:hypothetical protein|uniref:Uncharacterized protein n=1 Tax=Panicum virgatum TaxID=38727 RepID=A0A8T0RAX7_PANVG|nr:hypothetical protein PVAP13_6KG109540 [Panicum virgatum]